MKRAQVFWNTLSDLIFKIFRCLPVQIYLYGFDLAPTEDETQRYISNLRVSSGLGFNSNTESQNSWEQLKILALFLQYSDIDKLSPEMLTACCGHVVVSGRAGSWELFGFFHSSTDYIPTTQLYFTIPLRLLRVSDYLSFIDYNFIQF